MSDSNVLIKLDHIEKSFNGVRVIKDASFDFRSGEIHCICGENGAGKSTLIKMLTGAYHPDSGKIVFEGKEVTIKNPRESMSMGIQAIYQEHQLFKDLDVTENLFAGKEILKKNGMVDKPAMDRKAEDVLGYLKASISPHDMVSTLGDAEQKTVEIARALINKTKVLILDEPTSSFNTLEIDNLLTIVKQLRDDGSCILYISHHLDEVFKIADRVTVIRDGQKINTYDIENLTESNLINDMVGRDVSMFYSRDEVESGDVLLEVKNLTGNGVKNISFNVRKGEILGFGGMVGAGKTEMTELLFGAKSIDSGEIYIGGEKVDIHSPRDAIKHGMCYITEDRQGTGLYLTHDILSNVVICNYNQRKGNFIKPKDDSTLSEKFVSKLNIATNSIRKKVNLLSGGNQQKVILARWFATDGDIYIFDDPTKGIDIGAKEEIYKLMTDLLRKGKAIVLVSSDMPELISMSDRICIMRDGEIVGELDKDSVSEQAILRYSIGGAI